MSPSKGLKEILLSEICYWGHITFQKSLIFIFKSINIMSKNDYSNTTIKYLTAVRKYLKEKYGKVNTEWEQPLEILADNLELYQQCKTSIKNDGLLLVAKNGAFTKNSLIKVMFDAQIQITKIFQEFGLTPKSASKLNLVEEDDDTLKELLGN